MRGKIRTIAATKGFAVLATLAMGGSTAMALQVPVAPALPTVPTVPTVSTPLLPGQSATPTTPSGAPTATRTTVPSAPSAPAPTIQPSVSTPTVRAPLPDAPQAPTLAAAPVNAGGAPAHPLASAPKAGVQSNGRSAGRHAVTGTRGFKAGNAGPGKASTARTVERNARAGHRPLGSRDAPVRTTHDQAAVTRDPGAGAGQSGKPEGRARNFFGNVGNAAFANGPRWALILIIAFALTIPAVAVMRTARRTL
jgi:hypothetical protein